MHLSIKSKKWQGWGYIATAVIIAAFTHFRWFKVGVYSFGDWWHAAQKTAIEWTQITSISIWKSAYGLGGVDPQLYWAPISYIRGIFALLPQGEYWNLFLVYLLPITILAPIGSFKLIRRFIPHNFAAFVGSLVYTYSTYFLTLQSAHLTIALSYAYAPFLLLTVSNFFLRKKTTLYNTLVTAIIVSIGIILEPRIFFILSIFFIPWIFFLRQKFIQIGILIVLIVLLNLFWILPLIFTESNAITNLTERPLFGNEQRSMQHAMTNVQPAWSWRVPEPFDIQQAYPQFWIVTIVSFAGLLFVRRFDRRSQSVIIFMYIVTVIGIFLSKQSHPPLEGVYKWLFEHFPGFSLYRESSKFFILTSIGYAYLVSFFIFSIQSFFVGNMSKIVKFSYYGIALLIILFTLGNTAPLLNGRIDAMFIDRVVKVDYQVAEGIIENHSERIRVMGIPVFPRWMGYTTRHSKVNVNEISDLPIFHYKEGGWTKDQVAEFFSSKIARTVIDAAAIKYVFIPPGEGDNNDYFFTSQESDGSNDGSEVIVRQMERVDALQKIDGGFNDLVLYENSQSKNYIRAIDTLYAIDVSDPEIEKIAHFFDEALDGDFDFVNAATLDERIPAEHLGDLFSSGAMTQEVQVHPDTNEKKLKLPEKIELLEDSSVHKELIVRGVQESFYIVMSEAYSPHWTLHVKSNNQKIETHFKYLDTFNGWYIDLGELCRRDNQCTQNENGSYDLKISINFETHKLFIVGSCISGASFFAIIFMIVICKAFRICEKK